jgi:hypothetical protein
MRIQPRMNIYTRGQITEVGEGIPEGMNAPVWTPVRFEDGSYAVLDSLAQPLQFPTDADGVDYDTYIKHAVSMPDVGTLSTGRSTIRIDTADGRRLIIRVGWGFGKEGELTHRWENLSDTTAEEEGGQHASA